MPGEFRAKKQKKSINVKGCRRDIKWPEEDVLCFNEDGD